MTAQERELISTFLQQMKQTQAGLKDAEADALINAAVTSRPDSAYLLVQRAIGLDYALQAVKADLVSAQAELAQLRAGASGSFIDQGDSWGRSGKSVAGASAVPSSVASSVPAPAGFTPAFSPASLAKPPVQAAAAPAPAPAGAWGSSMLGTVATTAAGVVAGSFLFQGIQGLMGHHGAGQGDGPKAGDAGMSSVPPPSLPPAHLAAADTGAGADLPPDAADADEPDDAYADSGDGGDSA